MEALIPELSGRGYRVATIKHHSHSGFEVDQPGKDSWRYARAGSVQVIIAAPDKIASYRPLEAELTLPEILQEVHEADLVLVEGYKHAGYPTLEVLRSAIGMELIAGPEQRFAVAVDTPLDLGIPCFDPGDISGIADLIEEHFLS